MSTRLGTQSTVYGSLTSGSARATSPEYVKPTNIRSLLRKSVNEAETRTTSMNDRKLYSAIDHTTPAYTRNPDFWLKGYHRAYTCLSVQTEEANHNHRLCTAVTPRHAVAAYHAGYAPNVGTTVRFVTEDNVVVERTVVENNRIPLEGINNSDVSMVMFDSDLPDTIVPCKIFPEDIINVVHDIYKHVYPNYRRPDRVERERIVLVSSDQEYKTHPQYYTNAPITSSGRRDTVGWWTAYPGYNLNIYATADEVRTVERFRIRGEIAVAGDSGNPLFVAVNNELWLMSVFHGVSAGPFYPIFVPELNAMIATQDAAQGVDTGYTVTKGSITALR